MVTPAISSRTSLMLGQRAAGTTSGKGRYDASGPRAEPGGGGEVFFHVTQIRSWGVAYVH